MLPENIRNQIAQNLGSEITSVKPVSGGDINQAAQIKTGDGQTLFVKWNPKAPADMFRAEAEGLSLLAKADSGLVLPKVFAVAQGYLLMSWLPEARPTESSAYEMGRALAKLHAFSDNSFGLDTDNYIGSLPQSNNRHSNWYDFFAIERIEPQVQRGVESGVLRRTVLRKAQKLYNRLGSVFPAEDPALVHGDLWSGNFMYTEKGKAAIYDPAVYFGHREMDLAMTRLFGGFPDSFYRAYEEEFSLEPGFEQRISLYNLYPVLVHANLFGSSYAQRAESIIDSYV